MTEKTYPRRAYERWTDDRNVELVELLRAGTDVDELAVRTGRSKTALAAQCHKMLPPNFRRRTRTRAVEDLAVLVADPSYDWREPLREAARRARSLYWDGEMIDVLRHGWDAARLLEDLCVEFAASEVEVSRQLLRIGAAENMSEVAARLGCDPNGTLAARLRVAADRIGAAVWVLIVDGPVTRATKTGLAAGPATRHVSVHPDYDTADLAMADILFDHLTGGGRVDEITTTIVERTIGDGDFGESIFTEGSAVLPIPASDRPVPPGPQVPVVDLDDPQILEQATAVEAAAAAAPRPAPPRRWWKRRR
ncbi:hypothetical protein [Nocardia sp. NPDC004415]